MFIPIYEPVPLIKAISTETFMHAVYASISYYS